MTPLSNLGGGQQMPEAVILCVHIKFYESTHDGANSSKACQNTLTMGHFDE